MFENVLLHIPHASKVVPSDTLDQFTCSKKDLEREIKSMTDHHTDWLVEPLPVTSDNRVIAPVSRLIVDVERFHDDSMEVMSEVGMGVIYENGSQRQTIRRKLSSPERCQLLNKYYWPHHLLLEERTEAIIKNRGEAIIIDVHSYPRHALPYEINPSQARPEICIGTCDFHTPKELINNLVEALGQAGFDVALNTPFAGTIVPSVFREKAKNVVSFMIEVRRDVYMDESSATLNVNSIRNRIRLCGALSLAIEMYAPQ